MEDHHPIALAIAGWPWSELERDAYPTLTYAAVRASVERSRFCFIEGAGGGIAQWLTPTRMALVSARDVRNALARVGFLRRATHNGPLLLARFADAWLRDPEARTLKDLVFDPARPPGLHQNTWNNWPGIAAARLVSESHTNNNIDITPILDHVYHILCDGHVQHAEWLLDYMAAIVQRPWQKTMVAIVFTGLQGAGKNTLLDFFRERILGPDITAQFQDPNRGLLDKFGSLHEHRIFLQIDEADDRLAKPATENALKHLITGDATPIRRLFADHAFVPNYANLVLTTNGVCPIHLPAFDRRFVLFHVSPARVGDHAYFDRLHRTLADPAVARAFYDFLLARPVSPEDALFQKTRPLTQYYLDCRARAIDPAKCFLSAIVNQRPYTEVFASDLYADYLGFVRDTHSQNNNKLLNLMHFSALVQAVPGVRKRRTRAGMVYGLDLDAVCAGLGREYADEAFLLRPARPPAHMRQPQARPT